MRRKIKVLALAVVCALALLGAVFLPGSQPGDGRTLDVPSNCGCHAGFDQQVEPMWNWHGSMMSQASRDPIFFATLDLANDDLGGQAGTFCLRCHSPAGHLSGAIITDPTGASLTGAELEGIFCDFCHALVDPLSDEGKSLVEPDVVSYGNAMYVITDGTERRGPYTDPEARHAWAYSAFHRQSEVCASCHDVSNPLLCDPLDPYNVQKCFTEQRTYSEWKNSWYATQGEAGNCQSCHMPHVVDGKACKQAKNTRTFLPVHHLVGGNTFVPDAIALIEAGNNAIDFNALAAGKQRAINFLQNASTLEAFDMTDQGQGRVDIRITNLTGHKLPTGYPEGRRMWINMVGYDSLDQPVFESGAYDPATAILTNDPQIKIYETHFGVEQPDGSCQFSFRLVQNTCQEKDNRIPPRGFTNAAFEAVGAGHVHYHYPDGQFWDDTPYSLPPDVVRVDVKLYYQTTTREYIEFLATAPGSGARGATLLNAYNSVGKAVPVLMESVSLVIDADQDGMGDSWELLYGLDPADPADAAGDLDGDGLSNLDEYLVGSLPDNPDTDGDGLNDGPEVNVYLTNPADPDTDGDGLDDGAEVNTWFTSPVLADSDGGGEPDGSEVSGGRNPLDPADDGEEAAYDASWTAPRCTSGKGVCLVGESLIAGRDTILNGNEPNQPNTISGDPCPDGATGEFHQDESIDYMVVTDLSGMSFTTGDDVEVMLGVWCWTDVGLDVVNVYNGDSAGNWVLMGSTACAGIGAQTLTVTGALGATPGDQVIRAVFSFDSTPASCDGGSYADQDDVVISVAPGSVTDSDGDGLSDQEEAGLGTDPYNPDTDSDGCLDGEEVNILHSNPLYWDTDGDGLPDHYEALHSGDATPLDLLSPADGALDFDGDGNSNVDEHYNGSDPWTWNPTGDAGCFYWGEGGVGNGIIGPEDVAEMQAFLVGGGGYYGGVIPPAVDVQDMSGDDIPDPGDASILKTMILAQNLASVGSRPVSIEVVDAPAAAVQVGMTARVSVRLLNENGNYTSGFGVVFQVGAGSIGSATILGGDGASGAGRYDVTGLKADGAVASAVLRINSAGTIYVEASTPVCGTGVIGKSAPALSLASPVLVAGE